LEVAEGERRGHVVGAAGPQPERVGEIYGCGFIGRASVLRPPDAAVVRVGHHRVLVPDVHLGALMKSVMTNVPRFTGRAARVVMRSRPTEAPLMPERPVTRTFPVPPGAPVTKPAVPPKLPVAVSVYGGRGGPKAMPVSRIGAKFGTATMKAPRMSFRSS